MQLLTRNTGIVGRGLSAPTQQPPVGGPCVGCPYYFYYYYSTTTYYYYHTYYYYSILLTTAAYNRRPL
jgi:hypothetical protein